MPKVNHSADIRKSVVRHAQRIQDQERKTKTPARSSDEEIVPFSYAGAVDAAVSPPYTVRKGGQIVAVNIAAGTAASGSSTFKVRVNGTQVGSTLTLPSSSTSLNDYLGNVRVSAGSLLTFESATVGSGLADLGVVIVMKG